MSQVLNIELSDEVYAGILHDAETEGTSPAQVAAELLALKYRPITSCGKKLEADAERFERHFGSVDLGYETGSDNEGIDRDLAHEYGNNHEVDGC